MDEEITKGLEKYQAAIDTVRASPSVQSALDNIGRTMARIPTFSFPSIDSQVLRLSEIPRIPTQEEVNEYQSASVLMQALAEEALQWKARLPESYQPAVLAVLYGGVQISVQTLAKVSFHGIRVEGSMNGAPCSLLTHQSTVQLLCYAEEVKDNPTRRPIGFVWDDHRIEV